MNEFFTVYTYTPWDNLNKDELVEVRLISLKSIFKNFPVIESAFFDDLMTNLQNSPHYSRIKCIKRIIGPNKEDYDIIPWSFIWAMDSKRRIYQILLQKTESSEDDSKATMVALAPPELGKLYSQYKKKGILTTLSLLNEPEKMKFVMILNPKGKSIAEEQQFIPLSGSEIEKAKFIKNLKDMPNIKGEWFPSFNLRCPICNGIMTELKDYKIGFSTLVCPQCGFKKKK
jgi:hypothetical protein